MELSNADRARYYSEAASILRRGHTRHQLFDGVDAYCLVGAISQATGEAPSEPISQELQVELEDAILKTQFVSILPRLFSEYGHDGGRTVVEAWNDKRYRRKSTVVKLVQDLADSYAALAKDDRIRELEKLVQELKTSKLELEARVRDLEARVGKLETEVGFWKNAWNQSKAPVSARKLRQTSSELAELDSHLDRLASSLQSELQSA